MGPVPPLTLVLTLPSFFLSFLLSFCRLPFVAKQTQQETKTKRKRPNQTTATTKKKDQTNKQTRKPTKRNRITKKNPQSSYSILPRKKKEKPERKRRNRNPKNRQEN